MPLRVRRTQQAKADEFDIWLYIAQETPSTADAVLDRIDTIVRLVAEHPDAGRQRPDLGDGIPSMPEGRFMIFYRHMATYIEVVRIVGAARRIGPDLFNE